eukprot:3208130-Rhodomonas_salina.1
MNLPAAAVTVQPVDDTDLKRILDDVKRMEAGVLEEAKEEAEKSTAQQAAQEEEKKEVKRLDNQVGVGVDGLDRVLEDAKRMKALKKDVDDSTLPPRLRKNEDGGAVEKRVDAFLEGEEEEDDKKTQKKIGALLTEEEARAGMERVLEDARRMQALKSAKTAAGGPYTGKSIAHLLTFDLDEAFDESEESGQGLDYAEPTDDAMLVRDGLGTRPMAVTTTGAASRRYVSNRAPEELVQVRKTAQRLAAVSVERAQARMNLPAQAGVRPTDDEDIER